MPQPGRIASSSASEGCMSRTRHFTIWSLPVIRCSPVFSPVWLLFALALTTFGSRNAGAQSRSDLLVQVGGGSGTEPEETTTAVARGLLSTPWLVVPPREPTRGYWPSKRPHRAGPAPATAASRRQRAPAVRTFPSSIPSRPCSDARGDAPPASTHRCSSGPAFSWPMTGEVLSHSRGGHRAESGSLHLSRRRCP